MTDLAWRSLRRGSILLVRRKLDLGTEGLERIPQSGPVLIAARHYHHLYDGACLLATLPRPAHILVGLDWIESPILGKLLPRLCRAARWPVVDRARAGDVRGRLPRLRRAVAESLGLLAEGRIVIVFPEAYPNVDPGYTPKQSLDEFLPFEPGVVHLARMSHARGLSVPIVPIGFQYTPAERLRVQLRFGNARHAADGPADSRLLADLEAEVRSLSGGEQ